MESKIVVVVALAGLFVGGCAAESVEQADEQAPGVELDGLGETQSVFWDGWTVTAGTPSQPSSGLVQGTANFTRETWAVTSRNGGVCVIVRALVNGAGVSCNSSSDCGSVSVPSGGFLYCASAHNGSSKACFLRPGAPSAYCAGTPANGGLPITAPTFLTTPAVDAYAYPGEPNMWMSYGCIGGCLSHVASQSGTRTILPGGL